MGQSSCKAPTNTQVWEIQFLPTFDHFSNVWEWNNDAGTVFIFFLFSWIKRHFEFRALILTSSICISCRNLIKASTSAIVDGHPYTWIPMSAVSKPHNRGQQTSNLWALQHQLSMCGWAMTNGIVAARKQSLDLYWKRNLRTRLSLLDLFYVHSLSLP